MTGDNGCSIKSSRREEERGRGRRRGGREGTQAGRGGGGVVKEGNFDDGEEMTSRTAV